MHVRATCEVTAKSLFKVSLKSLLRKSIEQIILSTLADIWWMVSSCFLMARFHSSYRKYRLGHSGSSAATSPRSIPAYVSRQRAPENFKPRYASEVGDLESQAAHFCAQPVLCSLCTGASGWAVQRRWSSAARTAGGLNRPGFVGSVSRWVADTGLRFIRRGTGASCLVGNNRLKPSLLTHPCGRGEKWEIAKQGPGRSPPSHVLTAVWLQPGEQVDPSWNSGSLTACSSWV